MNRISLFFTGPFQVAFKEESLPVLLEDEALVQTKMSAISPGTERLIFEGLFPPDLPIDEKIDALSGIFRYPFKYGYASVGQVVDVGSSRNEKWLGRWVFSFHPHETHFRARPKDMISIDQEIDPREALFLPNMESAVNFLMDGRPVIGERVMVMGQGTVGLLTTALLNRLPLGALISLDRYPLRREASVRFGAAASLDPDSEGLAQQLNGLLGKGEQDGGADLVYELSGQPEALNTAIRSACFGGRIVIGSWYGVKRSAVELGGVFHRNRINLISSQVSTIAPRFSGSWSKERRMKVAWDMIKEVRPSKLITHEFDFAKAREAYRLLSENPQEAIQIVLVY